MELSNETVIHQKKNGIEYLQFRKLLEFEELTHAYTLKVNALDVQTRMVGREVAFQNYDKVMRTLGVQEYKLVKPLMAHTNTVVSITEELDQHQFEIEKNIDGYITDKPNIALATTSADCMTIMCYEPKKQVIANIHSGWKGTFNRIAPIGIQEMVKVYDADPKEIICCICPSIQACCFEVEQDLVTICESVITDPVKRNELMWASKTKAGKWYINMVEVQRTLLKEVGIQEKNIIDSGICTVDANAYLYSYRADKQLIGLNAGIIMKKGNP